MSKKAKVAVIGVGNMGKNHVRVYNEIENAEVVSVSDNSREALEEIERGYKGINLYEDYKDMIENENLDAVSIVVPTEHHHKVALDVIGEGINLLIEKPIAATLEEADEIIDKAKEKGIKLMVGHIERFNPAVQELKKRIDRGELGKVYKVDVNRVGPLPVRIQDVGVVIDLAVHDIDIMRHLTGKEPERIYAETEQRIHSKKEDLLAGMLRFQNRTICYLNVNWLTPTRIRKLYITGEKGMFVIDYLSQRLYFYENDSKNQGETFRNMIKEGRMIRFKIEREEPLKKELKHFINCVNKNKNPIVTGKDGKEALQIAHKLIESSERKEALKYP